MFLPRPFLSRSQGIDRRSVSRSHTRGSICRELLGSNRPISKASECMAAACSWTASSVFFVAITFPLDKRSKEAYQYASSIMRCIYSTNYTNILEAKVAWPYIGDGD